MRLDALVRKLIGSGGKQDAPPSRILEGMIAEIDAAITDQVSEVLTQDEFLRLEAAWRGLKFLVERTDFREPIKLEIVVTPLESLVPIYDEVVHRPELDRLSSEPLGLMVIDFCFDRTPRDVEILKSLSERAASLSVPVITAAAPALFGVHEAPELAGMEGFSGAFAGSGNEKWTALRESGSSRWLGMAFNRFLLRPAHAAEGGAARAFRYTAPAEHQEAGGLWGNPCWAVASLATRSFARTGWCTDIMGQRSATAVEDLPVRALPRPGGKSVAYPLEVMVSDTLERELSSNGLMALTAAENSDRAYLRYAASVHAPKKYAEAVDTARARLQSTLPFQFFVGRVLNYAMLIEPMIVPGRAPEEIAASYRGALVGLLAGAGPVPEDAVSVSVLPGESDASRCDLCLKLRWPGFRSLPEAGEIELRWTIL